MTQTLQQHLWKDVQWNTSKVYLYLKASVSMCGWYGWGVKIFLDKRVPCAKSLKRKVVMITPLLEFDSRHGHLKLLRSSIILVYLYSFQGLQTYRTKKPLANITKERKYTETHDEGELRGCSE